MRFERERPTVLVLASTYPRWASDPEPAFVHELSRRLVGRFRVIVLCPHAPGAAERELLDGVEVIRYRYAPARWERLVNDGGIVANLHRYRWLWLLVPGFVAVQWWEARRLIREAEVEVVHAHWLLPQGFVAAMLPRSIPYVLTSHGADLFALRGRLMSALKRFVLRRCAVATVVSEGMKDEVRHLDASIDVRVESMGVDLRGRFHESPGEPRLAKQLLFVGRLVEKKGLRHLLDALPIVLTEHPDVRLIVAGFGPEERACKAQVDRLGLGDSVTFVGAVSQADLPRLYRQSAVFVAPFVRAASGDQEGLGLVLVEALGCGCAVVVSDLPATRQLPVHPSVMRVPPADVSALAAAITHQLNRPPGGETVDVGNFDWEKRSEAYSGLLQSLLVRDAEDHARVD